MATEFRRMALLIGGRDLTGSSHAQGVEKDLSDFTRHLISPKGGSWEAGEIRVLIHPKRQEVLTWLSAAERASDYCVIHYAGHGCHYSSPLHETALCLSDNEEILVRELNPRTPRHLLTLDTCRKLEVVQEGFVEKRAMAFSASEGALEQMYRRSCRSKFDQALRESEEGRCVAYACDVNQIAGDNDQGGYFTQSILGAATAFHGNGPNRFQASEIQSLRAAFSIAHTAVQRIAYPQRPVLEEGRRIRSLPFAVK